jgi:hypothetical protein
MKTQTKQTKTNKQNVGSNNGGSTDPVSELKNRSEQLSGTETETAKTSETKSETAAEKTATQDAPVKPYVNFAEREFNRTLSAEKILEKLERWMPEQFKLAEVVGKWIWISFSEPPLERVRADLSQLGFHWNNTRKCWQHPCGQTLPRGTQEPREKYEAWFPSASAALRAKKAQARKAEVYFDAEQKTAAAAA